MYSLFISHGIEIELILAASEIQADYQIAKLVHSFCKKVPEVANVYPLSFKDEI